MKKKMFKRAGVAVLSMAMLLSMGAVGGISASAADLESYTLTLGSDTNSLIPMDNTSAFSIWKVADRNGNFTTNFTGLTFDKVSTTDTTENLGLSGISTSDSAADVKGYADQINKKITASNIAATRTGNLASPSATVEPGWYFIKISTTRSDVIAEPVLAYIHGETVAQTVYAKASQITLAKTISNVTDGTNSRTAYDAKSADVAVGDTVTFTLSTKIPDYSSEVKKAVKDNGSLTVHYVINDDPDAGLAAVTGSGYTVTVGGTSYTASATTYTVAATTASTAQKNTSGTDVAFGTNGISFTFADGFIVDHMTEDVVITYQATVKSSLTTGTNNATNNTAYLNFGHNYYTSGDASVLQDDANVYSAGLTIDKRGGSTTGTQLENVKFTLKDNLNNKYLQSDMTWAATEYKFTTNATGAISFSKLPVGTFTLTETDTIGGYVKLADPIVFTITDAGTAPAYNGDGTITISSGSGATVSGSTMTIVNPEANSLPGTGGMGTVMFTVGGAAIVLCAGFMFVIYMRKRRAEEE